MDFNYLYHRQQAELIRADAAACISSRRAHLDLAALYGAAIRGAKAERIEGTGAA